MNWTSPSRWSVITCADSRLSTTWNPTRIHPAATRGSDGGARPAKDTPFSPSDFDEGPEAAAALTQAMRQMTAHRMAYWQAWVDGQAGWTVQWRDAAFSGDNPLLEMTPEQLHEFSEDYLELVRGWHERLATAPEEPEREHVMLSMQAFPFRP